MGMTPFEGHDVIASGVEMPGASGGLNKALAVNALELHHGEPCYLIVETKVEKVRHDKVKDTDYLQRIHVLKVLNASPIDEGSVREALDTQARLQEEAAGIQRLPLADGETGDADEPDEPTD
jgi:hypothetical protein